METTPSLDETTTLTGPWTKGKVLGRGAVGTVFLAQLHDGRQAACKQIATEGLKGDDLKAIVREITVIQSLHHAHLTRYIGIEYVAAPTHKLSIFMEFAPGGSVRQLLKRTGTLHEDRCASYIDQVLKGLEYLHDKGVAHRDVKGANVLLSGEAPYPKTAKLADFGASKRIEKLGEDASGGGASGLRGTPRWMAPELIRGELTGDLEGWVLTDVWSVGCTLVEMATGKVPWPAFPNPMAAMFHIAQGIAPPLGATVLSSSASDFLRLCCRAAPADRPRPADLRTHRFLTLIRPPTSLATTCARPTAPPAGAERRVKPQRAPPSPPAGSFVQVEGRPRNRNTAPAPRNEPASPTKMASLAAAFPILQRLRDAASAIVEAASPTDVQPRPRKPKKNKRRVRLEQKLIRPREASSPPALERPRAALAGDRRLRLSHGFFTGSSVRNEARREVERSGPVQARHSRSARAATRTLPTVSGARRSVSSAPTTIRWPAVRRSL